MAIKVKITTNLKKLEKAAATLDALNGRKVHIGIPTGSKEAQIAAIHEWGLSIAVTDAMRGWFRKQGHPLKPTTTQIVIPERSFFRAGMDAEGKRVIKNYSKLIPEVISGRLSADDFLNALGREVATAIKEYATNLSSPPNSGFTIERKGSSNPLVGGSDNGGMIGAINYEVD